MTDPRIPLSSRHPALLFACAIVIAIAGFSAHTPAVATEAEGVYLHPSTSDLFRVRIAIEVEGNVHIAKNALVSRKTALRLPLKSEATLDYEERIRRPQGVDSGEVTFAERYYHEAESRSELNRNQRTATLRPSVRKTIVRRESLPEVIYGVDDYLQRDELDLLRVPVCSVALDLLLPEDRVSSGSEYEISREALVSVLNLTSIEASAVTAQIVTLGDTEARIQFRGKLDGSVDGVPTEIRVNGKLTFDRKLGVCTWLALGIHETREIAVAEPGFDVAATVKLVRRPLDRPVALAAKPAPLDVTEPIPEDRLLVELASRQLGFVSLVDRRWRLMSDVPGSAMMRMIDLDRSIAQCDFRPLATLPAGTQWTLEAFQADVKRTLGEQFRELLEAEESLSPAGLRVLRVVAQGSVQGIPIQWVMYHFSDDSGRRLLGTVTLEAQNVATFAGADAQLAGTLRFSSPAGQTVEAAHPEVASVHSGDPTTNRLPRRDAELQSASDLR